MEEMGRRKAAKQNAQPEQRSTSRKHEEAMQDTKQNGFILDEYEASRFTSRAQNARPMPARSTPDRLLDQTVVGLASLQLELSLVDARAC